MTWYAHSMARNADCSPGGGRRSSVPMQQGERVSTSSGGGEVVVMVMVWCAECVHAWVMMERGGLGGGGERRWWGSYLGEDAEAEDGPSRKPDAGRRSLSIGARSYAIGRASECGQDRRAQVNQRVAGGLFACVKENEGVVGVWLCRSEQRWAW